MGMRDHLIDRVIAEDAIDRAMLRGAQDNEIDIPGFSFGKDLARGIAMRDFQFHVGDAI